MARNDTEYILEFKTDKPVMNHNLSLIDIHSINDCTGANRIRLPDHFLILHHQSITINDTWTDSKNSIHRHDTDWKQGELLFVPSGSEIAANASQQHDVSIIRIKKRWLSHFTRRAFKSDDISMIRYCPITDPLSVALASWVCKLSEQNSGGFQAILEKELVMALTASIVSDMAETHTEQAPCATVQDFRERRVLEYIDLNLGRQITLSDIASHAAMSPFHFARRFAKRFGMSPMRYVTSRRVNAAQDMLLNSNRSLTVIAMDCGFSSPSHFTRAFKQSTGLTPSQYRVARS